MTLKSNLKPNNSCRKKSRAATSIRWTSSSSRPSMRGARNWSAAGPSKPCKHLVDILSEPPFAGSNLIIERQKDYPRAIDL
jgi:hypothetical protein